MFATGFIIGSISGTVACLISAALHWLGLFPSAARPAVRPALVPLHVSGVSRASLN